MTSPLICATMFNMDKETNYQRPIGLRLGEEDFQCLEEIAKRERTSVSAIVRRFIVEGLERYFGQNEKKRRKGK